MLEPLGTELAMTIIILLSCTIALAVRFGHTATHIASGTAKPLVDPATPSMKPDSDAQNLSTSITRSSDSILSRRSAARFTEEIETIVTANRASPSELVILITELCVKNYDAATALYFKGRDMGVLTPLSVSVDMFLNLCSSCIRVGSPHFVFKYFSEMDNFHVHRDLSFYNSIIKILTFKRYYKINLSISDMFLNLAAPNRDNLVDMENLRSIYSCMLYSSVETREFWRSSKFFKQILRTGLSPSEKDFLNVAKAIVDREDWINGFKLLTSLTEIDSSCITIVIKAALHRDPSCVTQMIRLSHTSASLCAVLAVLAQENCLDEYVDAACRRFTTDSCLVESSDAVSNLVRLVDVLNHQEKPRMNMELIVDKLLDVSLSPMFTRLGESVVPFVNAILRLILKRESPSMWGKIRTRIVPAFKRNLLVTNDASPSLLPDLSSYSLLFKSVSHASLSDAMDIYRMFESQSDAGLIVGNAEIFCDCLAAIASQITPKNPASGSRYVWTVANGIVNDMLSLGIYPTIQICASLTSILVKLSAVNPDDNDYYFSEALTLLTVTISKDYDMVPDMKLFVQAVTGAIVQRRMRWVNKLFSAMVDQHKRNKAAKRQEAEDEFGMIFSDCEEEADDGITVETVNYLLKVSAKIDSSVDIFLMLVELVLINKLSLRIEAVLKSLKPLSSKSKERLFGILKKYKYKVSRSNLC